MKRNEMKWTVVRHSGYGYSGNPQFIGGLESSALNTKASIHKVTTAGGIVFNTYSEAEDFAEFVMYYNNDRLIPTADLYGGFSTKCIDSLQIFLPTSGIIKAWSLNED